MILSSLRAVAMTALAAPVCRVCDFCFIFVPFGHYDKLEIFPYAIELICSIGSNIRQLRQKVPLVANFLPARQLLTIASFWERNFIL